MHEREKIIRLWFDMWLQQKDLGINDIFTENVVYVESWGPKYENLTTVKHWFDEWNTRGRVLVWDIKQFFHKENQTAAEWYFKCKMQDGGTDGFDGISLIEWSSDNKIKAIPNKDCAEDAQSDFSSGCTKNSQAGCRLSRIFCAR